MEQKFHHIFSFHFFTSIIESFQLKLAIQMRSSTLKNKKLYRKKKKNKFKKNKNQGRISCSGSLTLNEWRINFHIDFSSSFMAFSWVLKLKRCLIFVGIFINMMPTSSTNKIANWNAKHLTSASLRARGLKKCKFLHFNTINLS